MNFLRDTFITWTVTFLFVAVSFNLFKSILPNFIKEMYLYGKCRLSKTGVTVSKMDIPKKYFRHFYVSAIVSANAVLALILYRYSGGTLPSIIYWFLDFCTTASRKTNVSSETLVLAAIMYACHCYKRFYESWYLSVFSNAKINLFAYLLGLMYYPLVHICLLSEAEGFTRGSNVTLNWSNVSSIDWICACVVLLSSYLQYRTNVILVNLRKDEKGVVVTNQYKIPYGELFEYVSGPLQLTEIVIYLAMMVILRNSTWFIYITVFVVVNQISTAHMSHLWMKQTFKNYPQTRKIIIPYVL